MSLLFSCWWKHDGHSTPCKSAELITHFSCFLGWEGNTLALPLQFTQTYSTQQNKCTPTNIFRLNKIYHRLPLANPSHTNDTLIVVKILTFLPRKTKHTQIFHTSYIYIHTYTCAHRYSHSQTHFFFEIMSPSLPCQHQQKSLLVTAISWYPLIRLQ